MGRKMKPTHLHIVDGTKPDKPRVDMPDRGPLGEPPANFSPDQRLAWDEIVNLMPLGVLTLSDRITLEMACDHLVTYRRAREVAARTGLLVKHRNDDYRKNPVIMVAQRESELLLKLLSEIGMTPTSRARLATVDYGNEKKPDSEKTYFR